jgi:glycosyltransferase involved in cell wall biosynthesis
MVFKVSDFFPRAPMNRIFFLNRYFFPDHSATSQILSQLAFDLAQSGRDIHVITSRQRYDEPQTTLAPEEVIRGVTIHRIAGTRLGRSGLVGRGVDYLSFYRGARRMLSEAANVGDTVVTMTDPPLLSILGMRVARRKHLHLVNWLQDIYPEIASELGVPLVNGPAKSLLAHLRNKSLQAAAMNVVVGECMAEKVTATGVPPDRICVIPNWSDDERIVPVAAESNPFRSTWRLEGKFVVGYSGNLGRAHEIATILGAAEELRNDQNIVFLFIGGGHHRSELAKQVKSRGLSTQFVFLPYQESELLKYSLSAPDVHWISLRPQLEGLIVPSKFYGVAAAGRPTLAITSKTGEIGRLVDRYRCGLVIEPGDADGLATAIQQLSANVKDRVEMGSRARAMLESQFTRRHAFERWKNVLDRVA